MKILVIGSGGREHALVWKLKQSPRVTGLFCAPGNAGIARDAQTVPIPISDHAALVDFARNEKIGLTVVGPDDALAAGLVDRFEAAGLRIFGPSRRAAQLESSKVFAKAFMERHGIPTARHGSFSDPTEAQMFAQKLGHSADGRTVPIVVKADGLALGKGVLIARNGWEAALAIHRIMDEGQFGAAGSRIVIEEFLEGAECSVHALVDGKSYLLFPGAQDHKRALNGDRGLNTGGMGAFSPTRVLNADMAERVRREILDPFLVGIQKDGIDFRGMLFPGIMVTAEGPKVLEFNCRFGDPETQVLLPRMENDLLDLLEATIDSRLAGTEARWNPAAAVCVVLASGGYPEKYETGFPIQGLDGINGSALLFHAGTRLDAGSLVSSGGRVLGVVAQGPGIPAAREKAYGAAAKIHFSGCHFRTDIAAELHRS